MVQGRINKAKIYAGDFQNGMPLLLTTHSLPSFHGVIYRQMSSCLQSHGQQSLRQPVKNPVLGDGMVPRFHPLGLTATACQLGKAEEGHQIEGLHPVPFLPSRSILVGKHHRRPILILSIPHSPLTDIRRRYFRPLPTINLQHLSLKGGPINFSCRFLSTQGRLFDLPLHRD